MRVRVQRYKVMKYGGGAPDSLLSMGPERPRYATGRVLYRSLSSKVEVDW